MPNTIKILRSATSGSLPTAKTEGEPWWNEADLSFGVVNAAGVATDLIPVRHFSALAAYVVGDHVIEAGILYRNIAAIPVPGPWDVTDWTEIGAAGAPPAETDPLALHLTGGTMTGPVVLAADAAAPLEAVPLQQVETLVADYLPLAAGPLSPLTGNLHLPAAAPTLAVEATNKAYVDAVEDGLQAQIDVLASNLIFSGTIDVAADDVTPTPESGLTAGPLDPAGAGNINQYLIVTTGGTAAAGEIPAGDYNIADWLVSDGTNWVPLPIGLGAASAVTAPNVTMSPVVNAWTTVQEAVDGLFTDKLELAGGTMTGVLELAADPATAMEAVTLQFLENYVVDAGTFP